jgi:uncharacterized tellurite resistance protein B-like protein
MSMAGLKNVLKIFGGSEPTEEEKHELVKEAALMTLARATASDSNIKKVEVETVREIVERVTGEDVSAADVRVAANSKLFESAPLERYLEGVGRKIDVRDRLNIASALAEVINSDDRVSSREIAFYNMVAKAFQLTPAEIAGLIETD